MPDRLAFTYPGVGGCSHRAGMKIQLEYDLLSGEFSDVKIELGKQSDQAYSATRTDMAQKNELYIRDLGYFRLQDFKSIQDRQGYYLSRLKLRYIFKTLMQKTNKLENDFSNLTIIVIIKVRNPYGKRKYIQMEALSTKHHFINGTLVPVLQPKLS